MRTYEEMIQEKRQRRIDTKNAVLRIVKDFGPVYSVDIHKVLNINIPKIKGILISLEKKGIIRSEFHKSPVSGNGRRYYFIRK